MSKGKVGAAQYNFKRNVGAQQYGKKTTAKPNMGIPENSGPNKPPKGKVSIPENSGPKRPTAGIPENSFKPKATSAAQAVYTARNNAVSKKKANAKQDTVKIAAVQRRLKSGS